ncbi:hypothetical protein BC834DRAFT_347314 [Gloeopeniophorella convolvens]|nr:hypothetical protein BC834DRAFT_347314 [Gloeopeniophorella convolvens]
MSSDGRYMYQHQQQGMTSSYDYSSYPPSSYDAPQFPQNHARPQRAGSSHSHPPPPEHVSYNPPPPHYHPPYASPHYAVPQSAPQPQWNGEAWQFNQNQQQQPVAPASAPETPVPPALSRPEPAPAPAPAPASQRVYAVSPPQPQPPAAETRRAAGTPSKAADPPPQPKRKAREKEAAAPRRASPLPASSTLDIDFGKACSPPPFMHACRSNFINGRGSPSPSRTQLIESYRVIIDTTNALSGDPAAAQGRPPSLDALQRMAQSAALGLRLLGSTAGPDNAQAGAAVPSAEQPPVASAAAASSNEEGSGDAPAAVKRQKSEGPVPEGQTCLGCNATSTPEWRRGPLGPRTLCNACGLVYAKLEA